jgi:hypothetical protein
MKDELKRCVPAFLSSFIVAAFILAFTELL